MDPVDTRKRALQGSVWTLFGYGGAQVLRLGSNLVLAHLLFPSAFGVMALVTVFMQGLQMFSEVGIGPSIIQNSKGDDREFLDTAWTIQILRGFVLWMFSCLLAWPASVFFGTNDPSGRDLLYILPVIGFSSVLGGFNSTAVFSLNRHLRIASITWLELIPQAISVLGMIVWAMIWPSVWAMVSGWLIYSLVRLPLSHWLNGPLRNRIAWDRDCAAELLHFGKWIFFGTIVAFLSGSLDRILMGRLLTLDELGVYSIALTFARVGVEVSTRLSHTVLFPVLAKSQHDPTTLVGQSIQARSLILLAGGAIVNGFAIFSPVFFGLLYDSRYAGAGTIAQWLSILVWSSILLSSMERVPLALGHPRALFTSNLISIFGYALALPLYHLAGLPGFILGISSGLILAHVVLLAWIPIRRNDIFTQSLRFTLLYGFYAGVCIYVLRGQSPHFSSFEKIFYPLACSTIPCAIAGRIAFRRLRAKS